ncbi:hypothetical protein DEI82_07855 [Curtobacterium sp. MCBD17_019]|nr:hypothetical protein DEI82_07855 [Curtobacterium sp. MCBD17_019]
MLSDVDTSAATFTRIAYPSIAAPAEERRKAQADVRGHAAGYAAGLRAAEAEASVRRAELEAEHVARTAALEARTAAAVAALETATRALVARVVPVLHEAEETVVTTAVELAEAVVGHEIRASRAVPSDGREAQHPSGALATVRRVLASLDTDVALAVRLSPADAAAVAGAALPVPVVADPALRDGDAVVDLPSGILDARITTAFARVRAALDLAPDDGTAS